MDINTFLRRSNFNFYLPQSCELNDFSFREEGEKWSTLRFVCDYKGIKYRFKEFFLDWFYTGYPKSLMKNFMETYSRIIFKKIGEFNVFFGLDYKNLHAASIYHKGTQIEIEALNNYKMEDFEALISELSEYENEKLINSPFHIRSFHARSKKWDWFEEKRIALANWHLLPDKFGPYNVSIGELRDTKGRIEFFIFSNADFSDVMWLEMVDTNIGIENAYYKFRKVTGIYNEIFESGLTVFGIRNPLGPAIMQIRSEDKVITFTNNLFKDICSLVERYNKSLDFLSSNLDKDLSVFII